MNDKIKCEIRKLCENSTINYLASINEDGFPQMKAMLTMKQSNMTAHYFSTNTSSLRKAQLSKNPKASVYYCDPGGFKGALFTGTIEVRTDREIKARLWREGDEMYYPKGIDDEDYCVFKFTAETVNFYDGDGNNATYKIEELTQNE